MSGPTIVFPTRGVLDKKFRYRDAAHTDIAKTFERIKRQQKVAAMRAAKAQQSLDLDSNVLPLVARSAK